MMCYCKLVYLELFFSLFIMLVQYKNNINKNKLNTLLNTFYVLNQILFFIIMYCVYIKKSIILILLNSPSHVYYSYHIHCMKIELVFSITKPLSEILLNGFSKPSFTDVLQHYKYYILYQNRNISQAVMMRPREDYSI